MKSLVQYMGALAIATVLATPHVQAAPLKIMALGDSIAVGQGSDNGSGWRKPLQEKLLAAGVDFDFVGTLSGLDGDATEPIGTLSNGTAVDLHHQGYHGVRGNTLRSQLGLDDPTNVFTELDGLGMTPDVILLHLGTNSTHEDMEQRLAQLFDPLVGRPELANTHFIVAKIIPKPQGLTGTDATDRHNKIKDYNANGISGAINTANNLNSETLFVSILGFELDPNSRVSVVDMFDAGDWTTPTGELITGPLALLDSDGIHPNDDGYDLMADVWFDGLESAGFIPEPTTAMVFGVTMCGLLATRRRAA